MLRFRDFEKSGVYAIRNLVNNNVYIGSTKDFVKRWRTHEIQLLRGQHHSRYLQRAWLKYGVSSFVFEVVFYCCPEDCLVFEQHFIDVLPSEYNCAMNAGSVLGLHWKNSDETRQKMSKYHQNRTDEHTENLVIAAQHQSAEKRLKLSTYAKNRSLEHQQKLKVASASLEKREKASKSLTGKKRSIETRQLMSVVQRRVQANPEIKAKISAFHTGRKLPQSQIANMIKASRDRSLLCLDDVKAMRLAASNGYPIIEIANLYKMHRRTVCDIVHEKTWLDGVIT